MHLKFLLKFTLFNSWVAATSFSLALTRGLAFALIILHVAALASKIISLACLFERVTSLLASLCYLPPPLSHINISCLSSFPRSPGTLPIISYCQEAGTGNRAAAITALPEQTSSSATLGPYIPFWRGMWVNIIGQEQKTGWLLKAVRNEDNSDV